MSGKDIIDNEKAALAELWERDIVKVAAVFGLIYLAYIISGILLGNPVRGQINAIANLTFYIGVFALLALALNLHWGYTGLFNIGIAGFMAIAIYTMAMVSKPATVQAGSSLTPGLGLPIWVGILAGMAAAAIFGFVVALPALKLRADYFAIVTIAFSEIIRFAYLSGTFQKFTLFGLTTGTGGGSGLILNFTDPLQAFLETVFLWDIYLGIVSVFGTIIPDNPKPVVDNFAYGLMLLLFVGMFYWLMKRTGESPFGRVLKAIREDEDAANALGKNTNRFKIKSFMLGCALIGLGGILWLMGSGSVTPNFFLPRITFYVWIALIIGGAGSNTGSVLGGAVFAALLFQGPLYAKNLLQTALDIPQRGPPNFGQAIGPLFSNFDPMPFIIYTLNSINTLQLVFMGLVLIWLMHNRPEGMLGHRKEIAASIDLGRPETTKKPTVTDGGDDQ
ncbi:MULTISPECIES: branched-chain amino acid ABC transporter permease [unclassified Haladaptatus]|uniref:branched-chain amino acid ABC transporter permease n=1 Tax=unclassified Haladaptatus TaxID=2622732 RepID=UPI0023E7F83E|nr:MULTISPECIES: branched-chain amino acid ABC transporter permease [unclassified Haladaptatus]